jgi:hypothetical protein
MCLLFVLLPAMIIYDFDASRLCLEELSPSWWKQIKMEKINNNGGRNQVSRRVLPKKKPTATEEAFMRKVMMFFVIGFSIFSEAASLLIFFHSNIPGTVQMAITLQMLPILCVYKILSFLFPSPDVQSHPLIILAKLLLRHP